MNQYALNADHGFKSISINDTPTDIIVNGFSLKDTIFDVLANRLDSEISETLSEEIKEALAVKMRLKQGK